MGQPLLVVQIGPHRFGAPVRVVTEILARPVLTPLPRVPATVRGVAVVRGQPLVLFSPHPVLDLPPPQAAAFALRWEGSEGPSLVAVDAVERLWLPEGQPLQEGAWQPVVPARTRTLVASAWREGDGWVWEWPPDLPQRLGRGTSVAR